MGTVARRSEAASASHVTGDRAARRSPSLLLNGLLRDPAASCREIAETAPDAPRDPRSGPPRSWQRRPRPVPHPPTARRTRLTPLLFGPRAGLFALRIVAAPERRERRAVGPVRAWTWDWSCTRDRRWRGGGWSTGRARFCDLTARRGSITPWPVEEQW